ncbi:hypothetical protein SD10_23585 [Spirosoma radiotolerans]|uniref:DUF4175 domain-containing protein n=1 Tax=Spirosoma radiotolerans TaxID=1379870 RepID=A0A0E3V9S6_9BACT|nr:hypothetical protein SD10_23585 [Spirosoma radiotolerans]
MRPRSYDYWHVWTLPIAVGFISVIGLLAALIGDDVWDGLSWLCLAVPLVVIGRFVIKPQGKSRAS